jgi:outer membrane protein assembly factor BamC
MSFLQHKIGTGRRVAGILPGSATWFACTLAIALAGCSFFGSKPASSGYGAEAKHDGPLEVPPDLAPIPKDDRYALPDQGTSANALRSSAGGAAGSQSVSVAGAHARLMRDGAQRWLAVDVPPEKAYLVVKDFWPTVGMQVQTDEPAVGIVETDWQEKHANVPEGMIQRAINLVLESVTSTGLKDRYRARIERTPTDTSEIFISHQGLEEVYSNPAKTSTTWQPRPRDPELEAEMLQRLLLRFESGDTGNVAKAAGDKVASTAPTPVTVLPNVSHIVKDGAESHLEVDEPFDRAWRRIGLALDRGGFTVEDRDRTKGLYFVRYLDPDYEAKKKDARGLFARIFESDPKIDAQQFRVALLTEGDRTSVRVQDKDGHPESGTAGDRILKQLDEQMK